MNDLKRVKPIEGFFLTTKEGLIFDTKGIIHPPNKVIAYLRYIPDSLYQEHQFTEHRKGYFKVYLLKDREKELINRFPWYLYSSKCLDTRIQAVPYNKIQHINNPTEKFQILVQKTRSSLDPLIKSSVDLGLAICSNAKIPHTNLGVTGSLLVDLNTSDSDIDLVVYGHNEGNRVYELMKQLQTQNSEIRDLSFYNEAELLSLYHVRSTPISFADFIRIEQKKVLQGRYNGYDFYIRLVYKTDEIHEQYGDYCFRDKGDVNLKAVIIHDSGRYFTPCRYEIEVKDAITKSNPAKKIKEIVSYRGRFCEVARMGDNVHVQGKLEQVTNQKSGEQWYRVLLGRDHKDFMVIN